MEQLTLFEALPDSIYFEAHINIEPVFGERLEKLREVAAKYKFQVADLLFKKRKEDTLERSMYDTFMTGRHESSYNDLLTRMVHLIREVRQEGYVVWRYKIESVILDSRKNDNFEVLSENAGERGLLISQAGSSDEESNLICPILRWHK